jgi:sugar lactone lactonase YvrE
MLASIGRTSRVRKLATLIAATIGAALASPGCSAHSPSSTGAGAPTAPPMTGSVTVTVTPPPGGLSVDVALWMSGPAYSAVVSATATVTGLAPGKYTVTAFPTWSTDPIVSTAYSAIVSGNPASVTVNDTAKVSAIYGMVAGSGGLWVANSGSPQGVDRYSSAQLSASAATTPTTSLGSGDPRPFGVAFDTTGNLWVALSHGNLIAEYSVSQLSTSNLAATPAFTLDGNGGALNQPAGLAFDGNGNLWIANAAANTVVEFSAAQLAPGGALSVGPGGTPVPFVTIAASAGSLNGPLGLAFDFSNNLWVANANGGTVVKFTASQLAASGTPTPAVTVRDTVGSIVGPIGIAFDAIGNLWVANGNTGHNTVVAFAPGQIAVSGAPIPGVVLSANAGSLASPAGLAFDNSNNLWVANAAAPTVVQFTPQQLKSSGSPVPNVVVSTRANSLGLPVGIAFDPYPGNLPIIQCISDPWDDNCPTMGLGKMRLRKR